jgi:hypothetical protein
MSKHDWYRNTTWNSEVEEAFEAKFARTRQPWSRWQYLTIQAGMIRSDHPDVARDLLLRSIDLDGVEPGWVSNSYLSLGQLELAHGNRPLAIDFLRRSVEACPPDHRGIRGPHTPEQLLIQLLWFQGTEARSEAQNYFDESEMPFWGSIPKVPIDPGGHPYETPEDAAESLLVAFHVTDRFDKEQVDALFAADPSILSAFDEMLLTERRSAIFYPWADHGRWELPAFIGRCLVRHAGAEWVEGEHLKDWGLRVGGTTHELYAEVWRQLHRGMPLRGIYEHLRG